MAFSAFGTAPLIAAPAARADLVDDVIDQIVSPLMDAATVDGDAFLTPTAWGAFFDSSHWDDVLADLSGLGAVAGNGGVDHAPLIAGAQAVDPSAADLTASFQQLIYTPIHAGVEDWIDSNLGQQVDGLINTVFGSYAIGNGTAGTATDPAGGVAGWLFGDGGAGYDSTTAGVGGGTGGAAGMFGTGGPGGDGGAGAAGGDGGAGGWLMGIGGPGGNGGAGVVGGVGGDGGAGGDGGGWVFGVGGHGGDGGAGTAGGNGGDGGNGAWLLGSGGDGGNAGNSGVGGSPVGLPALGGAGGNAGFLGSHGAVGHYGTLVGAAPGGSSDLGTTGTWLTNSDGQVVILHGLNEVYKLAPYEPAADGFDNDDAAFLAANGFNAVRVGIIWSELEPEPGVFNTAYLDSIEQTVRTLGDDHIYSILDFHQDAYSTAFGGEGAPAWAVQTGGLPNLQLPFPLNEFIDPAENQAWAAFWSNADAPNGVGLENSYAQMLEYTANAFNGNPDVAGFEIMNEPSPGWLSLPTVLGSPFFDAQELTPFYDQAASAIRAVDPTTPVFFEPDVLANAGLPTHLGTVDATGTVFSFHDYCEFQLGPLGCLPSVTGIVDNAQAYADSHDIPAFMTEFGASSNQSAIAGPMQAANQHLIGWTEWAYTGQGDITTTASPPSSESLVYNPEEPPVGANVNTANLTTLAQPYPQVVSGTPNSWSFDNGTFQFSYSTERADGLGSFPADSQTTISVPAVEFPNGYQVHVTGGQVMSLPNAPELVIESNADANTVSVVVTPSS